jgi:hypothetical protein
MKSLLCATLVSGLMAYSGGAYAADEKVMMILDESGSMWGQIDGKAKIEIAREVIAGLLNDWSADAELGVMAYGHREKGSCDDIELIAPVGKVDAAALTAKINALKPMGKTPIAGSLRQAAAALKSTEEKATVLLLSDGLETCEADPCAVAAELEKSGVDFTAHVVGFDLKDEELKCIADNTGGLMLSASNASELNDALGKVVEQVTVAEPVVEEAPKSNVIFKESFDDAEMVMANFEIKNEDAEGYIIEDGQLMLISGHKGDQPYTPNSFQLSRALPASDWTMSVIFTPEYGSMMGFGFELGDPTDEAKVKKMFAGAWQDYSGAVFSGLWMTSGEKKTEAQKRVSTQYDNKWTGAASSFAIDDNRFEIQLSRIGRDYSLRIRGINKDGSASDWKQMGETTVLKPFKQIRLINSEDTAGNKLAATYSIDSVALYEGLPD